MTDRLYTLLFAILPKRLQTKLWNRLANKHGYHGLTRFGNGTAYVCGTKLSRDDFYSTLGTHTEERP